MPGPAFTFPVAVILNRFLTDDLVFILGIWVSSDCGAATRAGFAAGHAHQARARENEGRVYSDGAQGVQASWVQASPLRLPQLARRPYNAGQYRRGGGPAMPEETTRRLA